MLAYALLGVSLLFGLLWLARAGGIHRATIARNAGALALAAAALAVLVRGRFGLATALAVAAGLVWLTLEARRRPAPAQSGRAPSDAMSEAEARSILGVGPQATRADIRTAYRNRMRFAHPDQGGNAEAAARLNAARDLLLKQ
jgi:hypothetical protein